MTASRIVAVLGLLLAGATAFAGWGLAQGMFDDEEDRDRMTNAQGAATRLTDVRPIGVFGDGMILFEGVLGGERHYFVAREVALGEQPRVFEREAVGTLQDGRAVVIERSLRVLSAQETERLLGPTEPRPAQPEPAEPTPPTQPEEEPTIPTPVAPGAEEEEDGGLAGQEPTQGGAIEVVPIGATS